jgi:hypothetical protein
VAGRGLRTRFTVRAALEKRFLEVSVLLDWRAGRRANRRHDKLVNTCGAVAAIGSGKIAGHDQDR